MFPIWLLFRDTSNDLALFAGCAFLDIVGEYMGEIMEVMLDSELGPGVQILEFGQQYSNIGALHNHMEQHFKRIDELVVDTKISEITRRRLSQILKSRANGWGKAKREKSKRAKSKRGQGPEATESSRPEATESAEENKHNNEEVFPGMVSYTNMFPCFCDDAVI